MLALFLSEDIIISSFSIWPFKKHSYFHISSDGYWAYFPCNKKVTPSANIFGAIVGEWFEDFSLG